MVSSVLLEENWVILKQIKQWSTPPEAVENVGFIQPAVEQNADPMQTQTAVIKK